MNATLSANSDNQNKWSPIPPPKLNGGLYNGQPFSKNAEWANIPMRPTTAYFTNMGLRSANPPIGALFQMNSGDRMGNNTDDLMPGVQTFIGDEKFGPYNFKCLPCFKKNAEIDNNKCKERIIHIM